MAQVLNDEQAVEVNADEILAYHYPLVPEQPVSLAARDSLALKENARKEDSEVDGMFTEEERATRRKRMTFAFLLALILVIVLSVAITAGKKEPNTINGPTEDRFVGVEDVVPTASPSSSLELSAAYQILAPLVEDPGLLLDPSTPQGNSFYQINDEGITDPFDIKQRFALLAIYFSTGGPNWDWNHGWNFAAVNVCAWYGVATCRARPGSRGGHAVARLELLANNLTGTWPAEACLLEDLEGISIQNNMLGGEIPACLTDLIELRDLEVHNNNFSGPLPSGLMTMGALENLNVEENHFRGTLDVLFESDGGIFPAYATLRILKLANNQFEGVVPTLVYMLNSLTTLTLHGNSFYGSVAPMCDHSLAELTADCSDIECPCCTECF